MAIGRTNAGGGGAALNFKVVPGLTQPGTASENTIWVATERIGAWYFSATQPEGLQEWDVWFQTGTESATEFNALRKNGLQVYPLSAKQYVSGALVNVEAKSYQNGEWADWIRYIFQSGSGAKVSLVPLKSSNGTLNIGTDYIEVSYSVGNDGESGFYTEEQILIAGGSTLTVSAHCTERFQSDSYIGRFGLMKSKPTNASVVQDFAYVVNIPVSSNKADYEITVGENDGGNYYFCYIGIAKTKIYDIKWS